MAKPKNITMEEIVLNVNARLIAGINNTAQSFGQFG